MGTKSNPGPFDCYAEAKPDEPMFILLGRDPLAPQLIAMWAAVAKLTGKDPKRVDQANRVVEEFRAYLKKHEKTEFPVLAAIEHSLAIQDDDDADIPDVH